MWFAYLDESKDSNKHFVYCTLIIDSDEWNKAFQATKTFRETLKTAHGVYVKKEFRASEFVAGKGKIANRSVDKATRAKIFEEAIKFVATAGFFKIMSSINIGGASTMWRDDNVRARFTRAAWVKMPNADD
jgi:hypothetical protein